MLLSACGNNGAGNTGTPSGGGQATTAPTAASGPAGVTPTTGAAGPTGVAVTGTAASGPAETTETPGAEGTQAPPGGATAEATHTSGRSRKLKIALMANGTFGDKGFFDSAKAGVDRAKGELGATVKTIEAREADSWEPTLRQLAQGDYDLIIVGTFQMVDALNTVAPEFPKQKFVFFDATVDQRNVANIIYSQNQGSFLAGALAGCVVDSSELKNLSSDKVIGAVGGEDIDVINDFIVGYEQGAKYVDPKIEVLKSYNSGPQAYEDPAKGKELAAAQFEQGANIVFAVAGKTGLGVLEAAKDEGRYAIGVDSNQNGLYPGTVLTSMLKRVDNSVFDLIQMEATGSLKTGKTYPYGIQNNGVGLAEDKLYEKYVPEKCQKQVDRAKKDIASGKVEVKSAFK